MNVLAISGSLRQASINSAVLRAAQRLAPGGMAVTVFGGVGALPLFNPDLEARPPEPVLALHAAVVRADALLFASPEYAHGVTGAIKNTLDWLVGFEPAAGTHVAVFNAAPRARHADDALRETLQTMAMVVVEAASGVLPLPGPMREAEIVENEQVSAAIRTYLAALQAACDRARLTK
jgi:chromate reductase, NAD(P)H dehydrogenase (quinone)